MSSTQSVKIQLRRGTSAEWTANTAQVLSQGEPGLEFNNNGNASLRIGDGLNPWSLLPVHLNTTNVNTLIPGLTGLLGGVVTQSLVPDRNVTYDLGSTGARFRDLYLSGNSINLGNLKLSANPDGTLANVNNLIPGLTGLLGGVVTQPLIPDRSAGYDIGSTGARFGDIFMGAGYTLNVGNMQIGANPDGTLANVGTLIPGITALLGGVVTQHLLPNQNITYDLGATGARFRDLYLSSNSINLGDLKVSANPDGTLALEQIIQPVLSGASGASGASGSSGASGTTSRLVSTLGARGTTGPPGATGPDPNFKYRGVFTTGEIYKIGDVVTDNTNLYYCTGLIPGWTGTVSYNTGDVIRSPSTGYYFQARSNLPVGNTVPYNATTPEWLITGSPPSQYWAIIAKAGSNGSPGAPGATGSNGSLGATGANGSPGATGATGAAGQSVFFVGDFNPSTTYSGGQLVKQNGSVYYLNPYDNNRPYRTGDVVSYNNILYQASTNLDPGKVPPTFWNVITQTAPPSAMWSLVVTDGKNGLTGSTGADGQRGPTGSFSPISVSPNALINLMNVGQSTFTLPNTSTYYAVTIVAIGGGSSSMGMLNFSVATQPAPGAAPSVLVYENMLLRGGTVITANVGSGGGTNDSFSPIDVGSSNLGRIVAFAGNTGGNASFTINGKTSQSAQGGSAGYILFNNDLNNFRSTTVAINGNDTNIPANIDTNFSSDVFIQGLGILSYSVPDTAPVYSNVGSPSPNSNTYYGGALTITSRNPNFNTMRKGGGNVFINGSQNSGSSAGDNGAVIVVYSPFS
jgi:hypothetical protein